jgi:subtilisin-like proprotein convertase family protein
MVKHLLSFSFLFSAPIIFAQTFNGSGGPIQDFQTFDYSINVSGLSSSINTTTFGLERVCVNLTHSWDADITLTLIAPDGTQVILASDNGGNGNDMQNTCFFWDAPTSIASGSAPFNGDYQPLEELGMVNNNQNPNNDWILRVYDGGNGDQGTLQNWSLTFSSNPATFFQFTESNLPIVVLNTNGQNIPDEPKIEAQMGIIYNGAGMINHLTDPYNSYNNKIGIEQRGSSSADFPQKSYGFETRDVNGTEHDTILLGMPEENDWILYAPYNDKTCMRNILSYDIANKTGHYAPRTKLCELVLNGQYKGIYVLMEKIKRDNERVNIAKLNPIDITGDELTGGYIIKVDRTDGPGSYWTSPHQTSSGQDINLVHVEPKGDEIMPEQRTYIQEYVDSFETALIGPNFTNPLTGYRNYIDVPSFVDYLLLNEASKNVDGYRLSAFLYKDKYSKGGKLVAGPAWDYNLAWWNADYCEGNTTNGWSYEFNDICGGGFDVPFWWERLMEDVTFRKEVKCRWTELRQNILSISSINQFIDSVTATIQEAQARHFDTWPILGTYTWPNPSPIPADFPGEIQAMKDWIQDRFTWMDNNINAICDLSTDDVFLSEQQIQAWPNPFRDEISIQFYLPSEQPITIQITDITGKVVYELPAANYTSGENKLNVIIGNEWADGMYLLHLSSGNNTAVTKLLKNTK